MMVTLAWPPPPHMVSSPCRPPVRSGSGGGVELEGCALGCWKHGSLFDLRTGEALTLPAVRPVAVHAVTVEGDDVLVELSGGRSR